MHQLAQAQTGDGLHPRLAALLTALAPVGGTVVAGAFPVASSGPAEQVADAASLGAAGVSRLPVGQARPARPTGTG